MRSIMMAAALCLVPGIAFAQTGPACSGTYSTIRVSTIKPGKMATFEKAVKDQNDWYAGKGSKSYSKLVQIFAAKGKAYATGEVMTITLHPGGAGTQPEHDAAYTAFVSEFRDSSSIKSEERVCLPDLTAR